MPEASNNKKVVRKKTGAVRKAAPKRTTDNRADRSPNKTSVGGRSKTRTGHATGTISETSTGLRKRAGVGKAKASLALKFTIPVAFIVFLSILVLAVFLARMTTSSISNEILKSGVAQVSNLAAVGKMIILKANNTIKISSKEFLSVVSVRDDSGKLDTAAVGKHTPEASDVSRAWPVELGLTTAASFSALTDSYYLPNQKLDNFTPKVYLEAQKTLYAALKSGLLAPFIAQVTTNDEKVPTQALVAYLECSDSSLINLYFDDAVKDRKDFPASFLIARSETGDDLPTNNLGGLIIEYSNWVPKYVNLREYNIDGKVQAFSTDAEQNPLNPCMVSPGEIKLGGSVYKILTFVMPIYVDKKKVGTAYLGIRAEEVVTEVDAINHLLLITGALGVLLSIVTCFGIGFIVTKPAKVLIQDMTIVSGGNLEHRTRAHSNDEIGLIAVEFNEMTKHLLIASKKEKEAARLENELEMACEIQMKLLPPRLPKIKGFDIHAVYHPAKEVGGDYYDFFPIDKRNVGIIVADVSGKGIPGSMVMATTRTILRFVAAGNLSSADTLAKTNAMVAADIKRGMFVTAFYLVLDVLDKTLLCSSAGHNPMVIHHANDEIELINPNGIALGFDKGRIFSRTIKEQKIALQSGDRIVLYTDGVVEAMNERSEEYTDERFYEFVKKNSALDSETFIKRLLADLDRHKGKAEQHDDITVVTFRVL